MSFGLTSNLFAKMKSNFQSYTSSEFRHINFKVYMDNATNTYFVTLTFNFKVTGGPLKVRFWPFFHFLAQFSYTESYIVLWLVYIVPIDVLCKHAETWSWSSSLKVIHRLPKYLTGAIFGLFGDIFTLNADYIARKLLKMALEVEYMMEYQHPVCWHWLLFSRSP